ncbi:MAG: Rieske (2Fe-2S) protein [Alphaproteobacteria bacterium]|jgi:nitrite reductase/ring-hydroxylating ferredoxin subunit|nr:Rieske (2Fe-2S) protein [Alphaproteobacteria bacterium]
MSKYVVAPVEDIPPGGRKLVEVRGRPIVIFNLDGEFFGMLDRCPHQGGSLCEGQLVGLVEASVPGEYKFSRQNEIVRCPWHGWEFDIRTGQSMCEPDRIKATQYDVAVEAGAAVTEGPYVAETFDVTVEERYVVVEI